MEKDFQTFDKLPRIKGSTALKVELTNDKKNIFVGILENIRGEIIQTAYNKKGELITKDFTYFRYS